MIFFWFGLTIFFRWYIRNGLNSKWNNTGKENIVFSITKLRFCRKFLPETFERCKVFGYYNKFKSKDPSYPQGKSFWYRKQWVSTIWTCLFSGQEKYINVTEFRAVNFAILASTQCQLLRAIHLQIGNMTVLTYLVKNEALSA